MFGGGTQRLARQLIEPHSAGVEFHHELLAHLGAPETPDVIGDAGDGVLPRLGAEEIANIVRHIYQMLCAAHGLPPSPEHAPLRTRLPPRDSEAYPVASAATTLRTLCREALVRLAIGRAPQHPSQALAEER